MAAASQLIHSFKDLIAERQQLTRYVKWAGSSWELIFCAPQNPISKVSYSNWFNDGALKLYNKNSISSLSIILLRAHNVLILQHKNYSVIVQRALYSILTAVVLFYKMSPKVNNSNPRKANIQVLLLQSWLHKPDTSCTVKCVQPELFTCKYS